MADRTISLTAAAGADTTDTTKYQPLQEPYGGPDAGRTQFAHVGVTLTDGTTGNTGTLRFVLRDATTVFAVKEATITVNAQTATAAGTGSTKTATVLFPNGTDILDLAGAQTAGGPGGKQKAEWYVGMVAVPVGTTALDTSHAATVNLTWLDGSGE